MATFNLWQWVLVAIAVFSDRAAGVSGHCDGLVRSPPRCSTQGPRPSRVRRQPSAPALSLLTGITGDGS